MSVYLKALKSECFEFLNNIAQSHNLIVASVDLKAIVVQHEGQVVQLVMRSCHSCLPNQSLLALAIAQNGVYMVLCASMLCCQSQTHSQGSALSKGTGIHINAGSLIAVRMSLKMTVNLTKICQIFLGEVSQVSQDGVQSGAGMAFAQNETITVRIFGILGIYLHYLIIKSHQHLYAGQRPARMS